MEPVVFWFVCVTLAFFVVGTAATLMKVMAGRVKNPWTAFDVVINMVMIGWAVAILIR